MEKLHLVKQTMPSGLIFFYRIDEDGNRIPVELNLEVHDFSNDDAGPLWRLK